MRSEQRRPTGQLAILADDDAVPTQELRRMGLDPKAIAQHLLAAIHSDGYRTTRQRASSPTAEPSSDCPMAG
ncbi:hypothetical protein ACQP1G_34050 [Nocardia sp. CA-107356]|uniref:hypothetical protein n=1 Tax=Nocardia sp. CA-107356 TaxID=3239972 RepID=UPI003D8ADACB